MQTQVGELGAGITAPMQNALRYASCPRHYSVWLNSANTCISTSQTCTHSRDRQG